MQVAIRAALEVAWQNSKRARPPSEMCRTLAAPQTAPVPLSLEPTRETLRARPLSLLPLSLTEKRPPTGFNAPQTGLLPQSHTSVDTELMNCRLPNGIRHVR